MLRLTLNEVLEFWAPALIHQYRVLVFLTGADVYDGDFVSFSRSLLVEVADFTEQLVILLKKSHR